MKKLEAIQCLTIAVLLGSAKINAQDLLLFGGPNLKEYLEYLKYTDFSGESVCNGFGEYYNEFSSNMWNEFSSPYGNKFSSLSPWNDFSPRNSIPMLLDSQRTFYGYFTTNDSRLDAVKFASDQRKTFNRYGGDLEKVRTALCAELN